MTRSVQFRLADGERIALDQHETRRIYDALWKLAGEPGAVSAAALLLHHWSQDGVTGRETDLDGSQSAALRKAMSQGGS